MSDWIKSTIESFFCPKIVFLVIGLILAWMIRAFRNGQRVTQ
jgi:hypothetical protein